MVSSMDSSPHRARRGRTLLALALVGLLAGAVLGLGLDASLSRAPAAAAPLAAPQGVARAPQCTSAPQAGIVESSVPWPQTRYDLGAVGQITEGAGVLVAVIDSGVSRTNPQLADAVIGGGDMLDSTGDGRLDCVGHGTAVASLIAARPMAGAGLRGLAPAARILAVRVSERVATENGTTGSGDAQKLIDGIRAAVRNNPRPQVINLSISTTTDNPALRAAVQSALDADIVVVAAAGNLHRNDGSVDPVSYPAAYDGVVGVGAIKPTGERVGLSQVGSYVDIVAPGESIIGAAPAGGHVSQLQGTSFAAPFVAATAALIRARWPQLDRTEVVRRLLATADPASGARPSPDYGYGMVNPLRALTEIVPPDGAAATASPTPAVAIGRPQDDGSSAPSTLALAATLVLLAASAGVIGITASLPAGRRRNWRPGRIDP